MPEHKIKEYRSELKDHILPFWRNLKDLEYGGYYGLVDGDLKVHKNHNKSTIGIARILWAFSRAYGLMKQKEDLEAAAHAYEFLISALYDKVNGGFIDEVTYTGSLVSTTKYTIFQAYAIYGLSEYYRVTEDNEVLTHAISLFEIVEDKLYREEEGKYVEASDTKWMPLNKNFLDKDGVEYERGGVCYLHLLEAYTNLYKVWPEAKLRERISWLLDTFRDAIYQKEHESFGIYFDADWALTYEEFCYGRDIEAAWLIDDAMDTIDNNDKELHHQLSTVADRVYADAIQKDGTLIIGKENGVPDKNLWWYAFTEGVVGFYNAYTNSGDDRYLQASSLLWEKSKELFVDDRGGGEWTMLVDDKGNKVIDAVAHGWKTPYHTGRMCIEMIERLGK